MKRSLNMGFKWSMVIVVILQQWSSSAAIENLSQTQLASVVASFYSSVQKLTDTVDSKFLYYGPSVIDIPIQGDDVIEKTSMHVVTAPVTIQSLGRNRIEDPNFQCSRGVVVNEASQMSFANDDDPPEAICHKVVPSEVKSLDTESEYEIAGEAMNKWLIPTLKKQRFKMATPLLRIHSVYMRRNQDNPNEYMASIIVTDQNKGSSVTKSIDQQWVVFCSVLIRRSPDDVISLLDPTRLSPKCTAVFVRQGLNDMKSKGGATIAYPPRFSRHPLPSNGGNVILHDPQNPQRPLSPPPSPRPRPQSLSPPPSPRPRPQSLPPSPVRSRSPPPLPRPRPSKIGPIKIPRIPSLKPKSKWAQTQPKGPKPKRTLPRPRLPAFLKPKWMRSPFKRNNKPSKKA